MQNYSYPSKRPKVGQVKQWNTIYSKQNLHVTPDDYSFDPHSFDGFARVDFGYPFRDFYKVVMTATSGAKTTKYFYGETAHNQVRNYVLLQGGRAFHDISYETL